MNSVIRAYIYYDIHHEIQALILPPKSRAAFIINLILVSTHKEKCFFFIHTYIYHT